MKFGLAFAASMATTGEAAREICRRAEAAVRHMSAAALTAKVEAIAVVSLCTMLMRLQAALADT